MESVALRPLLYPSRRPVVSSPHLLEGVGVVHADVCEDGAGAVELLVQAEVHADAEGEERVSEGARVELS